MNQLEVTSLDSATLRVKYTELLTENKRLEQENQCVRNDLQEHKDEKARLMQQCDSLGQERSNI